MIQSKNYSEMPSKGVPPHIYTIYDHRALVVLQNATHRAEECCRRSCFYRDLIYFISSCISSLGVALQDTIPKDSFVAGVSILFSLLKLKLFNKNTFIYGIYFKESWSTSALSQVSIYNVCVKGGFLCNPHKVHLHF